MAKKYTKYGLNHHWINSCHFGALTPFFMAEVSPNEIFKGISNAVFRLAPIDNPVFMQLKIHAHIFYVPYRLLDDTFEVGFTGQSTHTWPTVVYNPINTIWGNFGIQPVSNHFPSLSLMPIRAFNMIWNEHFRNPNEQTNRSLDNVSAPLPKVQHSPNDYLGSIQTEIAQGGTNETVDSSGATIDVTTIRDAQNRQRFKERRATFGEDYDDVLRHEHDSNISDTRLQRPEHCASAYATMGISEVVATATSATEETGEYRGHGITGMRLRFKARKFPEPGILMGVMYARPRLQLAKAMQKMFLNMSMDDIYQPHLLTDTQQIVKSHEIYSDSAVNSDFGYVGKYDHLRTQRDVIAGSSEINTFTAYKNLTAVPTVAYLHQVTDQDHIFQDQTSTRSDLRCFFDHNIQKLSPIPRRRK